MTPSTQQSNILDAYLTTEDNILIRARAGTGKTSTLFMLLPELQGTTFMGAFNVAIKEEMEARVSRLNLSSPNLTVKTLHAAGLSAYKYGGGSRTAKVEQNKVRFIIDELAEAEVKRSKGMAVSYYSKYAQFINKAVAVAKRAGVEVLCDNDTGTWEQLIYLYDVDQSLPYPEVKDGEELEESDCLVLRLIPLCQEVYRISLLRCSDELDFDDMLLAPLYYNCRFTKYDNVLIDEAQDCSAIRREEAKRMLKPGGRMIAVADDRQCIYSFTGSEHNAMDILQEDMGMIVLPLSVTYRCPKTVVEVANKWVPDLEAHESAPVGIVRTINLDPLPCTCNSKTRETCEACDGTGTILGFWGEAAKLGPESVILCRNNRPIVELAFKMLRKGIPCQIEGRDFATSLINLCNRWKVRDLNTLEERLLNYKEKEAAKWRLKHNDERAANVEDKVDTVLCILDAVRSTGKSRVTDLTDKLSSMFGDSEPGKKPKCLILSSIHKSKGKEWDKVYILGANKYQPSKWAKTAEAIRGEENLMYVSVTRAKKELVFITVGEGV